MSEFRAARPWPFRLTASAACLAVWLSMGASVAAAEPSIPPDAADPWEGLNRGVARFNQGLDEAVFAPITHAYLAVASPSVRRGLGSVVGNLREPRTTLNDLAQGRFNRAGVAASRFAVNSTIGLLGVFDVAARGGLANQPADFGQTLGRYGVRPGPYLILPIIGPHNVRDAFGRLIDTVTDPVSLVAGSVSTPFGATRLGASALNYRADVDPAMAALTDAADPYVVMRSAYGQRRSYLVREATGEAETLPDFTAESPTP